MLSIYEYDEERELKLIRADERELGREEGRNQGIDALVDMCRELGYSDEQIVAEVVKRFDVSEEKAWQKIRK